MRLKQSIREGRPGGGLLSLIMNRHLSFLLLAVFALALSANGQTLPIPPKPTAWVTDNASVLSASEEQALNEKLEAFAQRSGSQFLIFIFPTIGEEVIEDYTVRVA